MLKLSDAHIEKLEATVAAGVFPDVETALDVAIANISYEDCDYHESPEEIALIRRRFEDLKAGHNCTRYESIDEMKEELEAGLKDRIAKLDHVQA